MVGSPWLGGIIMYGGCTGKKKLKKCSFFFFFFLITLHNCLFSSRKCKDPKFRKHTEMFVCLLLLFFFFFIYGILILIQIEKPLANTVPNRNKPRKQRNHNLIKTKGGATLPLGGGGGAVAPAKKKRSPPAYILILIGPPNDVHLAPFPFLFNT